METAPLASAATQTAQDLLQIIQELLAEVQPQRAGDRHVDLDSSFDKDLGLDSLARVELIARVERHFHHALPEAIFAQAETPRDLLRALGTATARVEPAPASSPTAEPTRGASNAPAAARTLLEVLQWHVAQHPDRVHIQVYQDDAAGARISYRQLFEASQRVAGALLPLAREAAEPVAIMLPSGPDYFFSFFGILLAGGIPVPLYPPARPSQLEDHMRRHARILDNSRARILITVPEAKAVARLLRAQVPSLLQIVTPAELLRSTDRSALPLAKAHDIAFIQYTSGSTGDPKGVLLSHSNLLANIRAMGQAVRAQASDVFVSWLPLYHDMGLIGAWLGSLYYAALLVVMSPLSFLARPERWLQAIHRHRGTLSAAPNFGYEYCVRRVQDQELRDLDLSCWRAALNGAETVNATTLETFAARFASFGFRAEALMPVYGLAESSVGLTFPPLRRGPRIDCIERQTFTRYGQAVVASDADRSALRFVSCGAPLPGHEVRVVDPAGHELPERQEGRLQFRGPSSSSGYYRNPDKTRALFDGDWLNSGDLAYLAAGEVFVTGRSKDIVIRAGRNIYPDELERAIGELAGVRTGRVAVFASVDSRAGTERLVVLAETRCSDPAERERLRTSIVALASDLAGMPPDEVVLAAPGTVLKTSSGKLRRAASRERYEKGTLDSGTRSVRWQVARLAVAGFVPQLRRLLRYLATLTFAAYGWSLYLLLAPVVWLGVTLLPRTAQRWKVMRTCINLLIRATRTPLRVDGVQQLPPAGQPCVLVANHASYLDSYLLVATLPGPLRFVAKRELAQTALVRIPLQRIGTEFVERFEAGQGVRDAQHLLSVVEAGHRLMFFAEGTFTRSPGLRPFHMGAFLVAATSGVPVVPIAIRGTRSMLRADSWFPRRGAVSIAVGTPLCPEQQSTSGSGDAWPAAVALRDQTRTFILRHCGEPDFGAESVPPE